jgi:hypothetical protein
MPIEIAVILKYNQITIKQNILLIIIELFSNDHIYIFFHAIPIG